MQCLSCNAENPDGMKFCGHCGTPLRTEAAETHAELRQLTVLFCDLVGSTELSEKLDPEELREITSAYHAVCAEVIGRYEGHIAQLLGDGVLVYFGYPTAHEDDARRAVHTALGILDGMARLNTRMKVERGVELRVRLGIHTGPVVVGEVGGGTRHEHLALGRTPNLAARIQGSAEPDTLVVSGTTHAIVHGFFDFVDLGAHQLKGISEVVTLHRVVGESGADSRMDVGRRTGLTPLTGRADELAQLLEQWRAVTETGRHTILVRGEAGIGKSRIVDALRNRIEAQSATVFECFCSPYYQNSALFPLIGLLERSLGFTRETADADKLVALEARLALRDILSDETLALMAQLLSIPLGEEHPPLEISPQLQRERTLQTLQSWLLAITNEGPVLWIVEDLHWTDPTTLEFVSTILAANSRAPLLAILTFRPDFEPPWHSNGRVSSMTLGRLAAEDTSAMVAHVAGGKRLPPEVVSQLIARTEGVPLFVEEVTKAVLEVGVLVEYEDRYELAGPLPPDLIPSTVEDSLNARLDRLGAAKPIAQVAATIGREFRFDVLSAVAAVDEPTLRAGLDRLVSAELVYEQGGPTDRSYLFKHALIQDAAYRSLLKKSRRELHRRIAETLTTRFTDISDKRPELVAQHFTAAGLADQAVPSWLRAGQLAAARGANYEAIAHLKRGLELLNEVRDDDRLALELEFNVVLSPAIQVTQGWASSELERLYRRSEELVQQLGDTPHRLTVLASAFAFHLLTGRMRQALTLATQVLELAKLVGAPPLLIIGHGNCCVARLYHGDIRAAVEHVEAGLALHTPEGEQSILRMVGLAARAYTYCYYSEALWMLGYPERALQASDRSVEIGRELEHLPSLIFAVGYQTEFYHLLRDSSRVLSAADENSRLSREQSSFWDPLVSIYKGWALAAQGLQDEGIAQTRDGIARYRAAGNGLTQVHMLAVLAEALGDAERWDEAFNVLAEAMDVAETNDERYFEPELYRLRGEFLRRRAANMPPDRAAQLAAANDSIHEALERARRQEARSLELRAAMSLCRLQREQGDAVESRQLLADVYAWFTEGFETRDLRDARALLAELSAQPSIP
jgi:class 3 adenylate cyclase/predicted ATPase